MSTDNKMKSDHKMKSIPGLDPQAIDGIPNGELPENAKEVFHTLRTYGIHAGEALVGICNVGYSRLIEAEVLFHPVELDNDILKTRYINNMVIALLTEVLGYFGPASGINTESNMVIRLVILYQEYSTWLMFEQHGEVAGFDKSAIQSASLMLKTCDDNAQVIKKKLLQKLPELQPFIDAYKLQIEATQAHNSGSIS